MHQAMQSLLETTETLRRAIQTALDQPQPRSSQENYRAIIGEAQFSPPESSHEGLVHKCEGLSRANNLTGSQDEDFQGTFVIASGSRDR
jgi:hypothetical protein